MKSKATSPLFPSQMIAKLFQKAKLSRLSEILDETTPVVMGGTLGTPPFKPEKNLVFFSG